MTKPDKGSTTNIEDIKSERILTEIIFVLIFCVIILILLIKLPKIPLLEILELKSLDTRFIVRDKMIKRTSPPENVVLILIDDESYYTLNRPLILWNEFYIPVINSLNKGGIKTFGFDFLQMIPTEKYIPGSDKGFAEAVKNKNVVMISMFTIRNDLKSGMEKEILKSPPDDITGVLDPVEDIGIANLNPDMDGYIRSQSPSYVDDKGRFRYAFSFLLAKKFLSENITNDLSGKFVKIGETPIPLDEEERMIINYSGPPGSFRSYSFIEVYRKAVEGDDEYFRKNFGGKAVLMSSSGGFSSDYHRTPFNGLGNPVRMSGVEIQANTLNTILAKNFLRTLPPVFTYISIYILIVLSSLISYFTKSSRSFLLFLLLITGYIMTAVLLFVYSGLVIKIAYPVSGMLMGYLCVGLWTYVYREKEKRKILDAFGRYVSPEVMDEILFRPGAMELGGERKEITVLFSDINGFTSMSEEMEPEEVIGLLNEYYTFMVKIIYAHRGTLKQIIGDELMVIFNAPIPVEDHKSAAVQCAVDMQNFLDRWNEKRVKLYRRSIKVKIGINSGEVVVGNIGSKERLEYTTIGDTINTASRIMDLNKELKTTSQILISRNVLDSVKDKVRLIEEYKTTVRGKKEEISVYEIEGLSKGDQ